MTYNYKDYSSTLPPVFSMKLVEKAKKVKNAAFLGYLFDIKTMAPNVSKNNFVT